MRLQRLEDRLAALDTDKPAEAPAAKVAKQAA